MQPRAALIIVVIMILLAGSACSLRVVQIRLKWKR